jgi:hypothetical protein
MCAAIETRCRRAKLEVTGVAGSLETYPLTETHQVTRPSRIAQLSPALPRWWPTKTATAKVHPSVVGQRHFRRSYKHDAQASEYVTLSHTCLRRVLVFSHIPAKVALFNENAFWNSGSALVPTVN